MPDSTSDIVTRCPQCNTAFRVTPNQLAVADGVVRCGSCLAVFKAIDYKTSNTGSKSNHTYPDDHQHKTDLSDDSLIIDDDDEVGLELNDDIYDLDTDNKNKKTSLFDRKLKPISQHNRESADESWALDMLADLEDDDIEPIKITRPPISSSTETKQNFSEPRNNFTPNASQEELLKIEKKETDKLKDDFDVQAVMKPESKRHFSFFKSKNKDNEEENTEKLTPKKTTSEKTASNAEPELDDLTFDFDENYEQEPTKNTYEFENHRSTLVIDEDESSKSEALYFEEDELTEKNTNDDYQEPELPQDFSENQGLETSSFRSHISDEEIEDAMHSRTTYASESNDYLSRIQPAPVEMEWYESERTQRWLWLVGATILGAVLLMQVATFRFDALSKNKNYRPYYETACKLIGCNVPNLIDTNKIRATNLIVRSHPEQANSLIIDAILINNASFAQPYPALKLEFSDLNNQILASRDLQPSEYLRGELAGATQMPANQPIQLSLPIIDPGENAINYQLKVIKAKPQR